MTDRESTAVICGLCLLLWAGLVAWLITDHALLGGLTL